MALKYGEGTILLYTGLEKPILVEILGPSERIEGNYRAQVIGEGDIIDLDKDFIEDNNCFSVATTVEKVLYGP